MRALPRRHRLVRLTALCAVLAQLWLNAAHAGVGMLTFCGDGSPDRSAALIAQLPPELRLPLDTLEGALQADCRQCAPLCCPALPAADPAPLLLPDGTPPEAQARTPAPTHLRVARLPPARGPPASG